LAKSMVRANRNEARSIKAIPLRVSVGSVFMDGIVP
jgi:hypothetical protein